jgi:hypothetical protein
MKIKIEKYPEKDITKELEQNNWPSMRKIKLKNFSYFVKFFKINKLIK